MRQIEERYISLLTDFGFKRIFGTKPNKDLLINFLNSLFKKEQVITDVKYLNSEHVGDIYTDRKAIFDVYCENEKGEKFIVEMQNAYQKYFKDRSLYYATFPIKEQAKKSSDWEKVLYGYVVLYVQAFCIDQVVNSRRRSVQFFIISKKYMEIGKRINTDADRGVTVVDASGFYSGQEVKMLFVLAKQRQSQTIFRLIEEIDPHAFVSQSAVIGVYGEGFDKIKAKGKKKGEQFKLANNKTS